MANAFEARRLAPALRIATRDELYDVLHARLSRPPLGLTPFERAAIAQSAAAEAAASTPGLPFQLRPGLIAAMLGFYDQLRRQSQQVKRFEELIEDALSSGSAAGDRGAERMLQQTRFLARTFLGYEARVVASGKCDEHGLRDLLTAEGAAQPVRHVIVTVGDWIADPAGLFVADFGLLSRLPGLESIDIVATEAELGAGFHERVHGWLPGLEECEFEEETTARVRPTLVTPEASPESAVWFTYRDREEELIDVARRVRARRRHGPSNALERTAVVFKQPLPYLYLAPDTLGAAGIPYQASAALPLAAEPTAAALDLVLDVVETDFARAALVALLRSPHLSFTAGAGQPSRDDVSRLDRALSTARYLGGLDRLERLAGEWAGGGNEAGVRVALRVGRALAPLCQPGQASTQATRLREFFEEHLAPLAPDDRFAARESRARAAISGLLEELSEAHRAHHDPAWTIRELAPAVRRAVEDITFSAEGSVEGVHLIDDQAARYGEFDDLSIVGLVENEWPERPDRNIFYPPALLKALGWPSEKDRQGAADARFLDLLTSASQTVALSTFTLEDDGLVSRSVQLDELPRARLSSVAVTAADLAPRVLRDEALSLEPLALHALTPNEREWAQMRRDRSAASSPVFHGAAGPRPATAWSVSALEQYLRCPFKFFAQYVLRLPEEPDDEEIMDPRRQGQFVHQVFEAFFKDWHDSGRRAITPEILPEARRLFAAVVDRELAALPDAEAGLERTRLLGSSAAAGLGEAVLRMEAERPVPVVDRLLEKTLSGEYRVPTDEGPRQVTLRGKADRIDLLADGTFRVIDYKLGWPPDRARALQLPIYSLCAEQDLARERGSRWTVGEAVYLAFKGPRRVVPLFTDDTRDGVLARAGQRLVDTIDAVHSGQFPPRPQDVFFCETCSFSSVCRTDYA